MELLRWQKRVLEESDLDIFEVIAPKDSGKTLLSLLWLTQKKRRTMIFMTTNVLRTKEKLRGMISDYNLDIDINKIYFINHLHAIKGKLILRDAFEKGEKIRLVVDDCFDYADFDLELFDECLMCKDYELLLIGTKRKNSDDFQIEISKQYIVSLSSLYLDGWLTSGEFLQRLNEMGFETGIENN